MHLFFLELFELFPGLRHLFFLGCKALFPALLCLDFTVEILFFLRYTPFLAVEFGTA